MPPTASALKMALIPQKRSAEEKSVVVSLAGDEEEKAYQLARDFVKGALAMVN